MKKTMVLSLAGAMLAATMATGMVALADDFYSLDLVATADPGTFVPWGNTANGRTATLPLLYETLTKMPYKEYTGEEPYIPVLAKEITAKGDGVYDIELWDSIYDADGNHLTAADVVFSYEMAIDEGSQMTTLATLESVTALDDYTVEMKLTGERKYDYLGITGTIYIVTEQAYNDHDGMVSEPVGTGKYSLGDFESNSYYNFDKREDYWGAQVDSDDPVAYVQNLDQIRMHIITDTQTMALALENGEIDYCNSISTADRGNFVNDDGSAKDGYYSEVWETDYMPHLMFNCSEESPLQDVNLRKALCYAMDADAMANMLYGPLGTAGIGYANRSWLDNVYDELLEQGKDESYYPYDPDLAKEYLEKSSYNGETIRVLVNPAFSTIGPLIQAYAMQIGVKVELQMYESALYEEETRDTTGTHYDIDVVFGKSNYGTWGGVEYFDATAYTTGKNHNFIYDEEMQRLFDLAKSPESTKDDILEMNQYIEDMCYGYVLATTKNPYIGSGKVQDFYCTNIYIEPAATVVLPD